MLLFKSRKGNNTLNKWNVIIKLYSNNKSNSNYLRGLYIHRLCARILAVISNNSHRKNLVAPKVRSPLTVKETRFSPRVGKTPGRREWQPTPVFLAFLFGSAGKGSTCNMEDLGSIPGLRRSPGEKKGYPLQYSGLENSMDYSPWGRKELDITEWLSLVTCSYNCTIIFYIWICHDLWIFSTKKPF